GILLRPAPEERPGPQALADSRRAADRDHHLDRTHLPPSSPTGSPGPIDPHRVRDHHEPDRQPGGLTPADTYPRISPYPRWPVSSACRPRSSAALTSAGTNPPSPVSSTFPASICSNRASSCPEAFNCSTRSWPVGSSGFFSSVMVMILTVPLGTAYTDHLTR